MKRKIGELMQEQCNSRVTLRCPTFLKSICAQLNNVCIYCTLIITKKGLELRYQEKNADKIFNYRAIISQVYTTMTIDNSLNVHVQTLLTALKNINSANKICLQIDGENLLIVVNQNEEQSIWKIKGHIPKSIEPQPIQPIRQDKTKVIICIENHKLLSFTKLCSSLKSNVVGIHLDTKDKKIKLLTNHPHGSVTSCYTSEAVETTTNETNETSKVGTYSVGLYTEDLLRLLKTVASDKIVTIQFAKANAVWALLSLCNGGFGTETLLQISTTRV